MKAREGVEEAALRWEMLHELQDHYREFIPFLEDVMEELGFSATKIQREIGAFMAYGPQYLMVQAQRSQAKTTIAAAFAVWSLIHAPAMRVLIVSAGGQMAKEIAVLIVRLITSLDVLECLRPDRMTGDRESTDNFDLHHSLKGVDKSPSVSCVGIGANLQGKRADLLIADDVESAKNATTATERAKLLHLTKDFTSINQAGRILWLGTPQTMDSIYNSLPSRGVVVRVWPGRYPTPKQLPLYEGKLAPSIVSALQRNPALSTGGGVLLDQGQPLDPELLGEDALQRKEQDQGTPYFQLQHMLSTAMTDALRFPLKPELLVLLRGAGSVWPLQVVRGMAGTHTQDFSIGDHAFKLSLPHSLSDETSPLQGIWAAVDPAAGGANADETAYAVAGFLNGNIILLSVGGIPGGYEEYKLEALAQKLARFKLDGVTIEKNMGYGAFSAAFTPVLRRHIQCQVDDELVTGQKEARIINTLAPVMGRGALIVHPDAIEEDRETIAGYSAGIRQTYSLFFQLAKMTLARGALVHDDRADALEAVVRHYQEAIAIDQRNAVLATQRRAHELLVANPLGRPMPRKDGPGRPNLLNRFRRR